MSNVPAMNIIPWNRKRGYGANHQEMQDVWPVIRRGNPGWEELFSRMDHAHAKGEVIQNLKINDVPYVVVDKDTITIRKVTNA